MRVHLHTPGGAGALRERHQRVESVYVNLFRIFPIISLPQIPLADINRATSSSPIWSSNSLCRDDIAICKEPVDSGSCTSGATKRFYFDEEYQTCRAFIYTGCGGNRNRFKTFESCINTCLRSKSRPPLTSLTFFWSFIFFLADVSPFQLCSDVQHTHISPFYVYTCAATILAFLYILCIFLRFVTVHSPSSIYQFALASVFSPAISLTIRFEDVDMRDGTILASVAEHAIYRENFPIISDYFPSISFIDISCKRWQEKL